MDDLPLDLEAYFDSLPDDVINKILCLLPIKDAATASTVNTLFYDLIQDDVVEKLEQFNSLFTIMTKAYRVFYRLFKNYPDGNGNGDDIQLSILMGGKKVFGISKKVYSMPGVGKVTHTGVVAKQVLSGECKIVVDFIHNETEKDTWLNDLDLFQNTKGKVEEFIRRHSELKPDNEVVDKNLIKYIMLYLMMSGYKTVYETVGSVFVKVGPFPYNLDTDRQIKLEEIRKEIEMDMPEHFKSTLKQYEPLVNIDYYYNLLFNNDNNNNNNKYRADLESLIPSVTACNRDGNEENKKRVRLEAFEKFSKSIVDLLNFINNNNNKQVGGKKSENVKNVKYVKTGKKYTSNKHSYVIYARGKSNYIRMKNNSGVFEYVKIKIK